MTACPCAQELVAARARERLAADDFSEDEIERILEHVPVATHNQRGLGTLRIGLPESSDERIDATALLAIVEESMSSEIYELMKRTDEVEVVEKAHRRPRFVEDCVREMIGGVVQALPWLPDESFVSARQENLETIHQHNVVAERHGTLAEIRAEITRGRLARRHTDLRGLARRLDHEAGPTRRRGESRRQHHRRRSPPPRAGAAAGRRSSPGPRAPSPRPPRRRAGSPTEGSPGRR